jgi:hypothetical protein
LSDWNIAVPFALLKSATSIFSLPPQLMDTRRQYTQILIYFSFTSADEPKKTLSSGSSLVDPEVRRRQEDAPNKGVRTPKRD